MGSLLKRPNVLLPGGSSGSCKKPRPAGQLSPGEFACMTCTENPSLPTRLVLPSGKCQQDPVLLSFLGRSLLEETSTPTKAGRREHRTCSQEVVGSACGGQDGDGKREMLQ